MRDWPRRLEAVEKQAIARMVGDQEVPRVSGYEPGFPIQQAWIDEAWQHVTPPGIDHLVRRRARSVVEEFSYDAIAHDQGAGDDS